jgi:formylglycine-generating enzyme required for sulfatase activity
MNAIRRAQAGLVGVALSTLVALLSACGHGPRKRCEASSPARRPSASACFLAGWAVPDGAETDAEGRPREIRRLRDGARMVLVPAGRFRMGVVDRDFLAMREEMQAHDVDVGAYYLDVHEVTRGQWARFAGSRAASRRAPLDGRLPATDVDFDDALAYAAWVGCDLPTEAEYEYASRAGRSGLRFPWGEQDDPRLRNAYGTDDGFFGTAPAMSFPPNAYGVHDLAGNVQEWCRRDQTAPTLGVTMGLEMEDRPGRGVIRGGSYLSVGSNECRVSVRAPMEDDGRFCFLGFRCAARLPAETCEGLPSLRR